MPDVDFDVTEVAVPWRLLTHAGHEIVFATETGSHAPAADPRLLSGVIFGQLGAEPEPRAFYGEMIGTTAFQQPIPWHEIDPQCFDGLLLPGGHAPGMRQYLGSEDLRHKVASFWQLDRPVGAICHGVLVLARAKNAETGRSVLWKSRTTCLPGYMERLAYWMTAWKLGRYYRTYPAYVEEEVRDALECPERQFERGPVTLGARGSAQDDGPAFVVTDGRYVSSRWPGDAYRFATEFMKLLG